MSVDPVDRVSPRAPAPHRDEPPVFPRRREADPDLADARRRRGAERLPAGAGRPLPAEIAFLAAHGVSLVLLQYGAAVARRQGASADSVLIAEGLVSEDEFYRALAAELKVVFLAEPDGLESSLDLEADVARGHARFAGERRGLRWLVAPRGAQIARLIGVARTSGRPQFALAAPTRFEEALRRASAASLARAAAYSVERVAKDFAVRPLLRDAARAETIVASFVLLAALSAPLAGLSHATTTLLSALFLSSASLRLYQCAFSAREPASAPALDESELPVYSIVVALYKEASVAEQLSRAIDAIDYPNAKLDVKFVVECDDVETAEALRAAQRRPMREIIVAPPGAPRTKPRALNVAMPFLRGSLVVVFDAEDAPEPDQLRKAAALFAGAAPDLACLQASLAIHNCDRNWMTALFAIDYAQLFEVFDPGSSAAGLPFFLGGSSNHFRVDCLRALGCWDSYNVTEDADLGLRLWRRGYVARTFRSRTLEEAPCAFGKLVAQRTRWLKGWMQTALVHCRGPARLFRDLGPARGAAILATFIGGILSPLYTPVFTILLFVDALFGGLLQPQSLLHGVECGFWCSVALVGLGAGAWTRLVAMRRSGLLHLWPALFCGPLWSLMLMLSGWRALRDLWLRPFYWDKTEHGSAAPPPMPAAQRMEPRCADREARPTRA
jgi:cellulose synthase/poly-beta-1,6-N-acetylglucosamine synthase-like glycosyltransferase